MMAATRKDSCSLTPTIKSVGAPWEETTSQTKPKTASAVPEENTSLLHAVSCKPLPRWHDAHRKSCWPFCQAKIFGQFSAKDKTLCKGDMLRPTLIDLAPAVARPPVDCRQQPTLRSWNAGPESQCGLWRLLECRSSKEQENIQQTDAPLLPSISNQNQWQGHMPFRSSDPASELQRWFVVDYRLRSQPPLTPHCWGPCFGTCACKMHYVYEHPCLRRKTEVLYYSANKTFHSKVREEDWTTGDLYTASPAQKKGVICSDLQRVTLEWFSQADWSHLQNLSWLVVDLPLWKNHGVRQLGWLFPIYGKIKMFQTTNQS